MSDAERFRVWELLRTKINSCVLSFEDGRYFIVDQGRVIQGLPKTVKQIYDKLLDLQIREDDYFRGTATSQLKFWVRDYFNTNLDVERTDLRDFVNNSNDDDFVMLEKSVEEWLSLTKELSE